MGTTINVFLSEIINIHATLIMTVLNVIINVMLHIPAGTDRLHRLWLWLWLWLWFYCFGETRLVPHVPSSS